MNKDPQLQRPDLNILEVLPSTPFVVSRESYPWISESAAEIPTSEVTLADGTRFKYGSIIGLNSSLEKFASNVPPENSLKCDRSLFQVLPNMLNGQTHPNMDQVMNQMEGTKLYKTGKFGPDAGRLYFAIERIEGEELPLVLRVAICRHKEQSKMGVIITKQKHGNVRKHDGGGR